MFDLLIKGGTVIDGTGSPGYAADVAINGDSIAAIGQIDGESARTLDATGRAVTPGFVDLHSHADFNFFVDVGADSKITQGVTLEYVGNCGISFCAPLLGDAKEDIEIRYAWYPGGGETPGWANFGDYLDALENNGAALNVATQVGHGTVRKAVMGMDSRAPDIGQIKRMQALVAESLDAGAMGFSTGLSMAPGSYSLSAEVYSLVQMAADRDKLYSSHVRDSGGEGCGLFVATEELIEAGRRTGCRVQYSHLKANGNHRGQADELLARLEAARSSGIDLAADQYPYAAASGPMSGNVYPRWALEGGRQNALERLQDDDLRAEIRDGLRQAVELIGGPDRIMIASYVPDRSLEGTGLDEVANRMGVEYPEALAKLYEQYDAQLILSGMAQPDVDMIATAPLTAVGSDGVSLRTTGPLSAGHPHPRSYGTFPRFFAEYVNKGGHVSLEEAVRKMTTLPAERLRLQKRGRVAPGFFADLVVLTPNNVRDTATFAKPHSYSVGVDDVFVNGSQVVADGVATGETPGRVIRDEAG